MSYEFPPILMGTLRVQPAARAGLGDVLDAVSSNQRSALLTEGSVWVWDALRLNSRRQQWEICALIPHVAGYVRDATDYGMVGAGWRRLRRLNPFSCGRLAMQGLLHVRGVLRRDFPTLLTILLEMEMANFRRVSPPVVFLHPQITDLLLAMDHGLALERAVQRIRRGFRAEPGLATNNLGTLLPRLRSWGFDVPYLLAPMHPRGYGMRPSRQLCEETLRSFKGKVVAASNSDFDSSLAAYWQKQGAVSALYDVHQPNLPQWERWRSWQCYDTGRESGVGNQESEVNQEILLAQGGRK